MKNLIYLICAGVFVFCASFTVKSGLPDTEVWLFDFNVVMDKYGFNKYSIGSGSNISKHDGYDSQPAFGDACVLWTSERDSGQTDIFKYDIINKTTTRLTNTRVSEYSPTFAPDGKNLSCVVVEPDSAQRLWLYDRTSFASQVMIPNVSKIGYHCWTDSNTVFLFLLTEPFSLAQCDVRTGTCVTVAKNIGRCMNNYRNDKFHYLYYTVKDSSENATILAYDLNGNKVHNGFSIPCLEGSEDFARYQRTLFMASGSKMYYWDMSSMNNKWIKFADLSNFGIETITRIAVSSDGKHIAVVDNGPAQK